MTAAAVVLAVCTVVVVGASVRPSSPRRPIEPPPRRWAPGARNHRWRLCRAPSDVDVAAWCQRVARSTLAGSSLTQALFDADAATPAGRLPFPPLGLALRRGRSLVDALDGPADPSTATGVCAPVLLACAEIGGPPAAPLERVADVLTARAADRDERRAATAQARLSARVLTAVPFAVAAFLVVTEPAVRHVLRTPPGAACVIIGAALNVLGRWWMSSLIGRSS